MRKIVLGIRAQAIGKNLTRLINAFGANIETALAAMQDSGLPCWAAGSANNLEKIQLPDIVKKVTIFCDEDENFTGQKAAYVLANRLKVQNGLEVEVTRLLGKAGPVYVDTGIGVDFCDFATAKRLA